MRVYLKDRHGIQFYPKSVQFRFGTMVPMVLEPSMSKTNVPVCIVDTKTKPQQPFKLVIGLVPLFFVA